MICSAGTERKAVAVTATRHGRPLAGQFRVMAVADAGMQATLAALAELAGPGVESPRVVECWRVRAVDALVAAVARGHELWG